MTLMRWLIMNSCHSQTHRLGKVTATKVVVAFGPSNIYCNLGLWGANVAMVYGQNQTPWECPLGGTSSAVKSKELLGQQIYMWTSCPPCLYSVVCYGLGNQPSTFFNCHWISSKVGWFPNPCIHSSE